MNQSSWKMSLEELVAGTEGRVSSQNERVFSGVGTDTRAVLKGKIFVALKGDTFDAHDFLPQAVQAGAAALVVHRIPDGARASLENTTVVEVPDTLEALQKLGRFWRRKMPAKILALTGSNGKTTTKEFAAELIGSKFQVHASKGSLNNHWGVPMSLLAIEPKHQFAIIEMGMNHSGEITTLAEIAEPDAVVVTMVGRGHLEGLGSIEAVALAKEEIYQAAPAGATYIFNLESSYTRKMYERFFLRLKEAQILNFAGVGCATTHGWLSGTTSPAVDVAFDVASMSVDGMRVCGEIRGVKGETEIPVFGKQNVTNLMAAASLALAAGLTPLEIWAALPRCQTVWGRNQWVKLPSGARVLFDGYNANPESMRAALDNFAFLKPAGRKFAVLGEMKEMGNHAVQVHREIGELAAEAGFEGIAFFGPSKAAFEAGIKSKGFSKSLLLSDAYEQSLAPRLLPVLQVGDIVLMKGSRGMKLEKALLDLKPLDFDVK